MFAKQNKCNEYDLILSKKKKIALCGNSSKKKITLIRDKKNMT